MLTTGPADLVPGLLYLRSSSSCLPAVMKFKQRVSTEPTYKLSYDSSGLTRRFHGNLQEPQTGSSHGFQKALIKEYTVSHIGFHIMTYSIFLN